ncbi:MULTISPECIES: NAD(P)H-dependent oxidoreductase [Photobacterium]|uniref:General stress protein 14 n=2 Tax=Photobacterium TaxID=657 RepID=A0A1Y6L154_9GAMM|nr:MULTISPECIES: NAD(P)H-dependent oxidoreductase [Photobacterium]SMY18002.1 General stress protein 14 [Photobacterium aquimaris]SMY38221.1 General stress protein 14 [Photobacterium andalusiense]
MSEPHKKILILFAHPSQNRSEINVPLFNASKGFDHVTTVDLYAEYPRYRIDIDKEQQRLRDHDVIVFMFPLYWYSTPSLLKEWQDLVLEYGFAYGSEGTALQGKKFLCALTAGGSESSYRKEGFNHFTIRELLQPLEQMAELTGMEFLAPFALFGAGTATEEQRVTKHLENWRRVLVAIADNKLNYDVASKLSKLNHSLDSVITE